MKTIIRTFALIIIASSTMAFSCGKENPIGGNTPEQQKNLPLLTLQNYEVKIYPFEDQGTAECHFTAQNAEEVTVTTSIDIKTELEELENGYILHLSEAKGLEQGKAYQVTITAKNGDGERAANLYVYSAFLNNPFEQEVYQIAKDPKTFNFDIDGNVEFEIITDPMDAAWFSIEIDHQINVAIQSNTTDQSRSLELTFKSRDGKREYSTTITQERGAETQDEIKTKERAAMMALYEALGGTKEFNSESAWGTDAPIEEWGGVQVNSKGYVSNIHLRGKAGYIPEEIGDLKYCWEFILSECNLTGELPKSIGEMENLKEIFIAGAGLSGNLSESSLSKIAHQLKYIRLSNNNFTGSCPEWLGDTPSYCAFWIQGNRLEGKIPEKVLNHKWWTSPNLTASEEETYGEFQLQQQEGYVLYE